MTARFKSSSSGSKIKVNLLFNQIQMQYNCSMRFLKEPAYINPVSFISAILSTE